MKQRRWMQLRRWLRRLFYRRMILFVVVGLVLCVGVITVAAYRFERGNDNFESVEESFWSITVYIFSGLEDRSPQTPEGRALATFGLLLGPLTFALTTGWLARVFLQWEKRMPQHLQNHFLLLNWNRRAMEVVKQLHHPLIMEREGVAVIVVLTDGDAAEIRRLKELSKRDEEIFEDFYLSIGDPTSERSLLNANAQDARTIIILADDEDGEHADEGTIRSLIMLRKIARDRGLDSLHVVVELVNLANDPVVKEIGEDFPGLVEQVSGSQMRTHLLAQATLSRGAIQFYRELLSVSDDTNEIYLRAVPPSAVGLSFREVALRVIQAGNGGDSPFLPLGLSRVVDGRSRIFCNPRPGDVSWRIQEGDQVVLLAYEPPGLDELPMS